MILTFLVGTAREARLKGVPDICLLVLGCQTFSCFSSPKFNSSPLKNDGWKAILSYWDFVTFQGRTVKLRKGIWGKLFGGVGCHFFFKDIQRSQGTTVLEV